MANTIFKGPKFYEEADKDIFKGRTIETDALFYLVSNNDFSVCYAESGEGKSSLINAGLCPKLREKGMFPVLVRFDKFEMDFNIDDYVWNKLKNEINEVKKNYLNYKVDYKTLELCKRSMQESRFENLNKLWQKLQIYELRINSYETLTPVFIFDQFEEVFTRPLDLSWTKNFFVWLEELYNHSSLVGGYKAESTQINCKVLLSLRSEYVCELDYWSMSQSQSFIPALKNNRYFLKPLTKGAAKEISNELKGIQESLNIDNIISYAKSDRWGEWDVIEDDTPCVSALILSLILTGLSEKGEIIKSKIEEVNKTDNSNKSKKLFDFLINNVYEQALKECHVNEDEKTKLFLDEFEDKLIDSNGRRRRVSKQELSSINSNTKNVLGVLKESRIINEVNDHYEISHDCLRDVIVKRKDDRYKLIEAKAKKLKEQREDVQSSFFLLILFVFVVCLLYKCYCDRDTFVNLFNLNGDDVVSPKCEEIWGRLLFANFAVIAILIHSAVKRLRISRWLSIYGLITNVVFLFPFYDGSQKEKVIPFVVGIVALGVPLVTLNYSFKYYQSGPSIKSDIKILKEFIPLVAFFLGMSLFLFYLCIFNDAIKDPEPRDSSWGIVVISFLAHELTRLVTGQKEKRNLLCLFILLLSILALNTAYDGLMFPWYIIVACLVCLIIVLIWMYSDIPIWKRFMALFFVASVIIALVILNMGFNIKSVRYNSVKHVNNWKTVTVKDANHIGIVSACNGDTLLPCVFNSIDTSHYACMTSNKIHYDREISEKEYKGLFTFSKAKKEASYKYLCIPKLEKRIIEIAHNGIKKDTTTTFDDTLKYYAAKTHFELRNANILFLKTGNIYSLSSVPSLDSLLKCQMSSLSNILSYMNNYKMISGSIDGDSVMNVTKSLARTIYLCQVKDRILKKDSVNLFTLCQDVMLLYFYDELDERGIRYFNLNLENKYELKIGDFYKLYHTKVESSQITSEAKSIEQWYNLAEMYTIQDLNWNASLYTKTFENKLKKVLERQNNANNQKLASLDNQYAKFNEISRKKNPSKNDIVQALRLLIDNWEKWEKEENLLNEYHNKTLAEDLRKMEVEKAQMEKNYQDLISSVFNTFYAVVKEDPGNIYNSVFINLCAHLYAVAGFRLYETSAYQKMLEEMENVKVSSYQGFKTMMDNINKIKNDAVDSLENSLIRRK